MRAWVVRGGVLGLLLLTLATQRGEAAEGLEAVAAARMSIQQQDLLTHLNVLASDAYEGREAGSRGGRAIGGYLEQQLRKMELRPAGDGSTYFQTFQGRFRNLLAMVEGSDPLLKEQVVLVGAHYDHVGYGNASNSYGPTGYIHNGADDNASGTSGLLEVMEAFSKLPEAPRRTVVFALWDAEEKGLLGSEHWVRQPTIPLSRVKFVINTDMIGRLRQTGLEVYGTRSGMGLRRLVSGLNEDRMSLDFTWEVEENSDHWPFYQRNIPFLMLHTGLHDDYHRPSDDIDKLNVPGMEQVSRLMFALTFALANDEHLSGFRPSGRRDTEWQEKRFAQPMPPAKSRLGIRWNPAVDASQGLVISTVTPGSAAQRGGLRSGDRLVALNGDAVTSGEVLRKLVMASDRQATFSVVRGGSEEPQDVAVTLDGNPVRIGISWKTDTADPWVVVLGRVVPGSPAAEAGLRVGDRVQLAGGKTFDSSEAFRELMLTLPSPFELVYERKGRMGQAELTRLDPIETEVELAEEATEPADPVEAEAGQEATEAEESEASE